MFERLRIINKQMKKITNDIFLIESNTPGKTVAVFGGIHGNEKAGVMTIDYLKKNLKVKSGAVYLVYGNPRAIKNDVRYVEKNLNRCFLAESKNGNSLEEKRAVELMEVLDKCDALLDLHAYNEPYCEAIPFAICESNGLDIVNKFGVRYVLTGIDDIEKGGTDAYMNNQGKIGICVELGAIERYVDYVEIGIKTAYQFLQCFKIVENKYAYDSVPQELLKSSDIYKKKNIQFQFTKKYCTFDRVLAGEVVCVDGPKEISYSRDKYILFPRDGYEIGVEAYILAEDL